MSNKIQFINVRKVSEKYTPVPSTDSIPDWYKKIQSYWIGSKKPDGAGGNTGTIKKCVPVFDAITAGYIIPSPSDVFVSQAEDGEIIYEWASHNLLEFHPIIQGDLHPDSNGQKYPKWTNPWGIKTPKGYSCLFVQPFHRESNFSLLPGIVDTDTYNLPVNFPFVLKDKNWTGLIPAGTAMVQVIPFKREAWKMEITDDLQNLKNQELDLNSKFFNKYKSMFHNKKEYK